MANGILLLLPLYDLNLTFQMVLSIFFSRIHNFHSANGEFYELQRLEVVDSSTRFNLNFLAICNFHYNISVDETKFIVEYLHSNKNQLLFSSLQKFLKEIRKKEESIEKSSFSICFNVINTLKQLTFWQSSKHLRI